MVPNDQQVGDGGIDGVGCLLAKPENITDMVLAQIKGGKYQLDHLRDFMGIMEREDAAIGVFTTVEPVKALGTRAEMAQKELLNLRASKYARAPSFDRWKTTSLTGCQDSRRSLTCTRERSSKNPSRYRWRKSEGSVP